MGRNYIPVLLKNIVPVIRRIMIYTNCVFSLASCLPFISDYTQNTNATPIHGTLPQWSFDP